MPDATTVFVMSTKPASSVPQSPRLLDQLREVLRYKHYSLHTDKSHLHQANFFLQWHGRNALVHDPRGSATAEVRQCSRQPSGHTQKRNAIQL